MDDEDDIIADIMIMMGDRSNYLHQVSKKYNHTVLNVAERSHLNFISNLLPVLNLLIISE